MLILPLRNLSVAIFAPSRSPAELSTISHTMLTFGLLVCVYVAATALPDLGKVLQVLGFLVVIPLCFVVPARLAVESGSLRLASAGVMAAIGVLASVLSMAAFFRG